MAVGMPSGQGWAQIGELVLALVLAAAIGMEREVRQKSAGLRTHTLVGFGAALIVLVSKYGFTDVLGNQIRVDPSRAAASIVAGIGFIGGGLIFVRKDAVRGLTTAATIWLAAAVGMAAGAGLWLLAMLVTAGHFLIMFVFPSIARHLPRSRHTPSRIRLIYEDRRGVLRRALAEGTARGFVIGDLDVDHRGIDGPGTVAVRLTVHGAGSVPDLVAALGDIHGVIAVTGDDTDG